MERDRDGGRSSDEDEESGMEWEEVVQTAGEAGAANGEAEATETAATAPSKATNGEGIEVTLKPSKAATFKNGNVKGKGRPAGFTVEAALARAYRQELHKVHTSCLLISGHIRNGWINDKTLQARLLSKIPLSVQNNFHNYSKTTHPKATDRSRLFETAIRGLLAWWTDKFHIEDTRSPGSQSSEMTLLDLLATPHSIATENYADMQAILAELAPKDKARLMMPFAEEVHLLELEEAFPSSSSSPLAKGKGKERANKKAPKLAKAMSTELGELIRNPQSLSKRAVKLSGTKDVSVQLFTAVCRALDVPARLVCSLPAIDYRSANKMKSDERTADVRTGGSGKSSSKKRKRKGVDGEEGGNSTASISFEDDEEDEDEAEFEEVEIPSAMPSKALKKGANARNTITSAGNTSDASVSASGSAAKPRKTMSQAKRTASLFAARKGKARAQSLDEEDPVIATVPTFWTEVYNRSLQEWIIIDVVRSKIRPRKGEMDNGRLFYVAAYEVDQYIKDVTPRYAKSYSGRTLKMRIAKKKKEEPDWWEELLRPWQRPFMLGREMKEDEELAKQQETEPMPTVLEGFKNHPRYILERHLKREEVIPAKTRQLGLFRGEPVYPRSAMLAVKSAETWMREGRKIAEGQQPMKLVKQRAVTINKRRMQEMAEQEGYEPVQQGLYARSQTELVIPPPLVNGKVPKNSFGNMDLFAPHMLPKGAVHLPFKSIRKVAKDLGVDFAEAITGFEFHKRRAVPTISGIIIASENEEMVLDAYYASETLAVEKEIEKRKQRCLKRWKKLIIGLRLRSRLQGEYKGSKNGTAGDAGKGKGKAGENGMAEEEKSQFQPLPQDDEIPHLQPAEPTVPPDPSASQGGFIHTDGTDATVPGGAAFPPMPQPSTSVPAADSKVDFSSFNLPPMPAPTSGSMDTANGGNGMDLHSFTLAGPEEIAEGGLDINMDEQAAGGGGFMREEDEEEEEKNLKKKDFADMAKQEDPDESDDEEDMVDVMAQQKPARNGKGKAKSESESNEDESEEDPEEEIDEEEEEEDYREPTRSPPPKSKRAAAKSRPTPATASTAKATAPSSARRSTRATNGKAKASSPPASAARATRSSRTGTKSNGATAVEESTSKRPTRAAASKSRGKVVVDVESEEEEEDEEED